MNQKALKTLEYNKIIAQLEEYASTQIGKTLCRELVPSCSLEEIRRNQTETTDAATRVRMKGSLSFGGVKDMRGSLKRLEIGSSLNIIELLAVSSLLTVTARAKAYGRREESELPDDSLDEMFRTLEPLTPVNTEIKRCIISEDDVSDDASRDFQSPQIHEDHRRPRTHPAQFSTQFQQSLSAGGCNYDAGRALLSAG